METMKGMFSGVLVMFIVALFSGIPLEEAAAQGFVGACTSIVVGVFFDIIERREKEKEGE